MPWWVTKKETDSYPAEVVTVKDTDPSDEDVEEQDQFADLWATLTEGTVPQEMIEEVSELSTEENVEMEKLEEVDLEAEEDEVLDAEIAELEAAGLRAEMDEVEEQIASGEVFDGESDFEGDSKRCKFD